MLKSWVLEVKAITLHQPCPSLASGPCLWDSTCPLFTYKAMLNQTTTSSASIIFTFKVGILVGLKSRILLVPSFLYIYSTWDKTENLNLYLIQRAHGAAEVSIWFLLPSHLPLANELTLGTLT